MCRDRLVLRNLPEVRTRDELLDFVEAKSKLTVDNILFGEEEGTAVVIFETDVGEFFCATNSGLCLTLWWCFLFVVVSGNGDTQMCESEGGGNKGIQS